MRNVGLVAILLAAAGNGTAEEPAVPPKVSMERGLRWLAQEQDATTGGWRNDPRVKDPDPVSTALAVLAFVGAGCSPWPEEGEDKTFSENLRLGVSALARMQGEDGCIGDWHSHALATAALAEVYRYSRREEVLPSARKAVAYLEKSRVAGAGWKIETNTIFGLLALNSARKAGLEFDAKAEAEARAWLLSSVDPKTGAAKSFDPKFKHLDHSSRLMCAAGVYLACHWAGTAEEDKAARTALVFIGLKPPPRSLSDGMYDWFFGAVAMSCYGRETFEKWLEAAGAEFAKIQDPPRLKRLDGSTEAFGPIPGHVGRVAGTAVMLLTSQVVERRARALGVR